ncbi:hypothetical protein M404DRAFT_28663 [Pisolithus tinctorius Marx 270]|uniref:Uncharacterized protein n=1 Tax=Pisolithus tinctorius Marx 270 TaxID=870435 RepID=A0A0C3JV98_PISTI|nr:hypothetical protein M404DRAFT_28663 [Pisolithus tinctorius Marx 270]
MQIQSFGRHLLTVATGRNVEFVTHDSADPIDVHSYEFEDGPGPDSDALVFDMMRNANSPWNSAIIDLLLQELRTRSTEENWPTVRSERYLRALLVDRYKRLRMTWRKAQPKLTKHGIVETPAETEARLIEEREEVLKLSRRTTRRRNKFTRRATILEHIVKLKTDEGDADAAAWTWLQDLVLRLGEHGASSEESDVENEVEGVLRVKNMKWRRHIKQELDIVDLQRFLDVDTFSPQGSRPMRRIRAPGNRESGRTPVKGLPIALYDDAWIKGLSQRQLEALEVSPVNFPWMKVAVV